MLDFTLVILTIAFRFQDPSVHGIMIYYPAFGNHPSFYGGSMDDYLRDSVLVTSEAPNPGDEASFLFAGEH